MKFLFLPHLRLGVALSLGLASLALQSRGHAQLVTYAENFNTLPTTTPANPNGINFSWADNSTLANWYSTVSAGNGRASTGNDSGLYFNSLPTARALSMGAAEASERSLGLFRDGFSFGVELTNTSGSTLTQFTLAFTGEQWISNSASNGSLLFAYSTDATSLTSGTYTGVSQLNYTNTVTGGTSTAINSTGAVLGTTAISHTVTGLTWNAGDTLWLRWTKNTNNHLLAIDDLDFSAVPEPSAIVLVAAGLSALLVGTRRRRHT